MQKEKIIKSIQKQLETAGTMLGTINVVTNIQMYFLTEYEGKKALTKNSLFRFQNDSNLPSSPKKYDFLDATNPKQITLSVNENRTKYRHIEDTVNLPSQHFVVASPIVSKEHGVLGSLCFAGNVDPIENSTISFEKFTVISESLAESLAHSLDLFDEDILRELSK